MAAWANTALVGRLSELELLEEQVRQATAGRGGMVLVAGDAGIGKTRLVTELGARARAAGAQSLVGRCIDLVGAEVPYLPVAEAVRPLTARLGSAPWGSAMTNCGIPAWPRDRGSVDGTAATHPRRERPLEDITDAACA